jgi:transposase-like protein
LPDRFCELASAAAARLRKIALTLARGESTSEAAKKFGVTPARVSQLRLWLKESWEQFQGEAGQVQVAAA